VWHADCAHMLMWRADCILIFIFLRAHVAFVPFFFKKKYNINSFILFRNKNNLKLIFENKIFRKFLKKFFITKNIFQILYFLFKK